MLRRQRRTPGRALSRPGPVMIVSAHGAPAIADPGAHVPRAVRRARRRGAAAKAGHFLVRLRSADGRALLHRRLWRHRACIEALRAGGVVGVADRDIQGTGERDLAGRSPSASPRPLGTGPAYRRPSSPSSLPATGATSS